MFYVINNTIIDKSNTFIHSNFLANSTKHSKNEVRAAIVAGNYTKQELVDLYKGCMNLRRKEIVTCVNIFKRTCNRATIRSIKTVRMTLENALDVTKLVPDLKIIMNVRSPMATSLSRKGSGANTYMSKYSRNQIMKEAEIICKLMNADLFTYTNQVFTNSTQVSGVMVHQYESLCLNATKDVLDVYEFLQRPVDSSVEWVLDTLKVNSSKLSMWLDYIKVSEFAIYRSAQSCDRLFSDFTDLLFNELELNLQ